MTAGARSASALESFNWSGYADSSTAGAFTAVSGTWRQPATACSPEQRLTAYWVGLDGVDNATVEQLGITPLTFFRRWNVTRGSQTSNGITGSIGSGPSPTQLVIVDATATYPLDRVSGLLRGGSKFTARWLNSY